MQIWNEIKQSYHRGSTTTRIIYVNVAVFVIVKLLSTFISIANPAFDSSLLIEWLAVPALIQSLPLRFWTVVSYQFVHFDFLHLLFNVLWLYWFGQMFLQHYTRRQILSVYLWGGLWGAALYILSYNFLPYYQNQVIGSQMIGASASILALVIATATAAPNQDIHLMLIGKVKLKYLAIGVVLIDLLSITASNSGGHIAHLGGALGGFLFANEYLKRNKDITLWIAKVIDQVATWFKPRPKSPKMNARHTGGKHSDIEYNQSKKKNSQAIDSILEKIKHSGYDSLTKSEKEQLFKASK